MGARHRLRLGPDGRIRGICGRTGQARGSRLLAVGAGSIIHAVPGASLDQLTIEAPNRTAESGYRVRRRRDDATRVLLPVHYKRRPTPSFLLTTILPRPTQIMNQTGQRPLTRPLVEAHVLKLALRYRISQALRLKERYGERRVVPVRV